MANTAGVKNTEAMRKMCAALVAVYQGSGPFPIQAIDEYADYGASEPMRQRFYKALRAEYFVVHSSKHKNCKLYMPGPNISIPLTGEPPVREDTMPPLYKFFGMNVPENFNLPYPGAHIHKTPWESTEE